MCQERKNVLRHLLAFDQALDDIRAALAAMPWDCDEELVILSRKEAISILQRYSAGDLSSVEVMDWAECIECREDIGFEVGHEDALTELIFELANPLISRELSSATADEWITALSEEAT